MEKIKGFSIELSLDSMKVDSGLKDLRASMRLMNSEMRNNMSAFDRGEKSLKKYETQLGGLNKKLEVQKTITESARKHYEKMVDEHGEGSVQAQKAAAAYNHESAQLNNLQRHIDRVTKEMNSFKRQQEIQSTGWYKTGDALETFGTKLGGISKKARDVGGTLTKSITLPALTAGSALASIALVKGFGRLVGIDTAKAKLEGLGHTTKEIDGIMESALESVKGTSYGLEDAATIAASAVAAGVKEGKELTNYLSLTGDAAAIAGVSLSDMGSIFNKVQTSNKAYNSELQQLSERGLPVYKWLAEEAKVSEEAVFKMASDGEISTEMFLNAVEKNIGGAAKKIGEKSFTAAVANMWAAVGRLGASFLDAGEDGKGFFSQVKPLLTDLTEYIDSMGGVAENMGEKLGNAFASLVEKVKNVIHWYKDLTDSQKKFIIGIGGFIFALGPLLTGLGIFGGFISKISKGLGVFLKVLAPILTPLKGVGSAAGGAGKSVGLLSRAFTFMTGPVGIAIGVVAALASGFTVAYKKSETFRNFVDKLGQKIKEVFFGIVDWVKPGYDAVIGFFGEVKEKLSGFISSEGPSFIQAWKNIWDFISPILEWIADKVKWAFETIIKPIISLVMKTVEGVIKMVWGNIKGIITGALDVIMGAVKIFSGLFTGDFSKMWEGVKQLTSGAIKIVCNWIQLQFIGRILKGVGGLAKGFWGHIKNMWAWVKETFKNSISTVYNGVKNSFVGRIIASIINFVKNFRQRIADLWNGVKNTFTNSISTVYNGVKNSFVGRIITSIINFVKNFRTHISNLWTRVKEIFSRYISNIRQSIANSFVGRIISSIVNFVKNFSQNITNMWTRVKSTFSNYIGNIRNAISNSFVGRIMQSARDLRTKFVDVMKRMWEGTKKQFDKIVDGAKALPGRIGNGIRNAKDKAVNGMKSVGNGILNAAGKPINATIDGVNWILKKVKAPTIDDKWKVPQYAKGTKGKGHKGGNAIIGEKGRELVKLPDGRSFVSPDSHTLLNLPKGTHVVPNKPTEQILRGKLTHIPHYAEGTKGWKSTLSNIWDFIKKPAKAVSIMMNGIKVGKNEKGIAKNIASGTLNYLKDKPVEFIKNIFKKAEEKGGALQAPVFGGKFRLSSVYGPRWGGFHGGVDFAAPTGTPIRSQSNGKVSFAGYGWNGGFGNLVRVVNGIYEHYYAHMSAVMAKTGQQVKQGDILGLVGSTGDSTGPHVHYEIRRNGQRINPLTAGNFKGFSTGGVIKSPMMAILAEDDEEIVIPTAKNRRTDAMKLLALAAKKIGADNGSFARPGNLTTKNNSDSYLNKLLQATLEQNKLLMQLLRKDPNIIINKRDMVDVVNEENALDGIGAIFD